ALDRLPRNQADITSIYFRGVMIKTVGECSSLRCINGSLRSTTDCISAHRPAWPFPKAIGSPHSRHSERSKNRRFRRGYKRLSFGRCCAAPEVRLGFSVGQLHQQKSPWKSGSPFLSVWANRRVVQQNKPKAIPSALQLKSALLRIAN